MPQWKTRPPYRKQPSAEDLDHDFRWRHSQRLPERGRIGIFNRSYYEAVRVVHWKFSPSDVHERQLRDRYLEAHEDATRATASTRAPWFVVPADNKWFTRLVVAAAIVDALERLDLTYPKVDDAKLKALAAERE